MNATRTTFRTVAAELAAAFQAKTRANGDTFHVVRDGAPAWISPLEFADSPILAAHEAAGYDTPNDFAYRICAAAAEAIAEHDDADDAADGLEQFSGNVPDVYTSDLLAWASAPVNQGIADEAAAENPALARGPVNSQAVIDWARTGQEYAARAIAAALLEAIKDEAARRDDAAAE
jgi:hypothetical protein